MDPTLTDKEVKIGHSKFLDIVDSYDVFHHARFIVNFNRETYGIVKNWQIINTLYIDMFCYIRVQPTRTPFSGGSRGSTAGGRNQIGAKRRGGECGRGYPPPAGEGSGGGLPREFFLKNGCKWCILSPFFADCVLIFSTNLFCEFLSSKLRSDIRDAGEFLPLAV